MILSFYYWYLYVSYTLLFLHMQYMYVCMLIPVSGYGTDVYKWRPKRHQGLSSVTLRLLTAVRSVIDFSLSGQPVFHRDHLFLPPGCEGYSWPLYLLTYFYGFWGFQFQSSHLHNKPFAAKLSPWSPPYFFVIIFLNLLIINQFILKFSKFYYSNY